MQNKIVKTVAVLMLILAIQPTNAQNKKLIDGIIGVVGNNVILNSDVESRYLQYQAQGIQLTENTKCEIMEDLLFQKLLVNQAKIDSIEVSDSEVEASLANRLQGFIDQIGGIKELEEYFGKPLPEIKENFRKAVREQMITQRMQGEITSKVNVSPKEVVKYFQSLKDSEIPVVDVQYEVAQIVIRPTIPVSEKQAAMDKLAVLRERVLKGEKFTAMAILYSEDPGSATRGGELGFVNKSTLDPAFADAAFNLDINEISGIVESEFGYHIIQLIERRGEQVNVRHILIRPKVTSLQRSTARNKLDSIATMIRLDSIKFDAAALRFSDETDTKASGGLLLNPNTGSTKFIMNELPDEISNAVKNLKVGEISPPFETRDRASGSVYQIIMLKAKTPEHKANLNDDYATIQQQAEEEKRNTIIADWVKTKQKTSFISVGELYKNCDYRFVGWLK
ncbi:MAG TPA: peptidylprolyl isomerase [Bacteroidales bacterium]|nr:peptidylprolyl isomerase [Bacteroidales bacterium]